MMTSLKSNKLSLPPIKPSGGRQSVQFSTSGRTSPSSVKNGRILPPLPRRAVVAAEKPEAIEDEEEKPMTFRFVYSESVERAFRRRFLSTDFGPISSKPAVLSVDIVKLPQIYDDWLSVKTLIAKKQEYIQKLKRDRGAESPKYKYGRNRAYNRQRSRLNSLPVESRKVSLNSHAGLGSRGGSYQRLPSILGSSTEKQSAALLPTHKSGRLSAASE